MKESRNIFVLSLYLFLFSCSPALPGKGIHLEQIRLPDGFSIALYADNIPNARSMTLSPGGTLFVGTRRDGNVYAVLDHNKDNQADEVITIAQGLNRPNGVAFRQGALYVAEVNRILRYDNIERNLRKPPNPAVVSNAFPNDQHHGWKYIAFGPDDWLYVPVGVPCNVCERTDSRYGTIMRMQPDGSNLEIFAQGIRNTVGFDWHPVTRELWFTNNGRDWLGEDIPPDTLHRAPAKGLDFGFPYCHAGNIPDPEFGKIRRCDSFAGPAARLDAHVAPLGMAFYTGDKFPEAYRNQIFIAEHGSWNRTVPIGYRITMVRIKDNQAARYEVFAQGWLQGHQAWGRPVDVLVMPDGALLISDDRAGAIYCIDYN